MCCFVHRLTSDLPTDSSALSIAPCGAVASGKLLVIHVGKSDWPLAISVVVSACIIALLGKLTVAGKLLILKHL